MKYMMEQMSSLEDQLQKSKQQQLGLRDQDLTKMGRIESHIRQSSEQQLYTQQEITQKVKLLEDQVSLGDKTRQELNQKLRVTEDNNREMVSFIKNLQTQGDQELSSMRQFLQQKISEDHANSAKVNEKNSVLFNEMVRLGQENEKYSERVQAMQSTYEQRIQALEGRLVGTEQSTVLADRKGETNQSILAEVIDKLEAKVLGLEQNFHYIKGDF